LKRLLKTILLTIGLQTIATPVVYAQDLLAAQSPLDKQMELVDSIALRDMLLNEENMFPADGLYETWTNNNVRFTAQMPDSFRVDLRNFAMPTTNTKITDVFGYRRRRGRVHNGIDVKVQRGDTIYAAFDGKVRITSYQRRGYGHYVVIRHNNGLETYYAHLSERSVQTGDWVVAGQQIGLGGNTGRSTGPHLHYEVRYRGQSFDPERLINFRTGELRRDFFLLKKSYFSIYSKYEQDFNAETERNAAEKKENELSAEKRYYKVRSGDYLGLIAKRHGTTVSAICRLNGIKPTTTLQIGKVLRVK
jgi:hypothetical protein